MKKLNKITFHNENIISTKLPNPGFKTGFHKDILSKVLGSGRQGSVF